MSLSFLTENLDYLRIANWQLAADRPISNRLDLDQLAANWPIGNWCQLEANWPIGLDWQLAGWARFFLDWIGNRLDSQKIFVQLGSPARRS